MVAAASIRTNHLTITRIKLTALTQGETVSLVWTEELVIAGLHQGDEGLDLGVHQLAVDALNVNNMWILRHFCLLVDRFEPLHVAVARNRVASKIENGLLRSAGTIWTQSDCILGKT